MHAGSGKWRGHHILQRRQNIIGVQHRIFRHLAKTIRAMTFHIRQSTDKHAHLPMKSHHPTKWLVSTLRFKLNQVKTILAGNHIGQWRKSFQPVGQNRRP